MKHILILGGGFGGVEAVYRLRNLGHKVTLVSDRDYCFIYPTSIWIPVNKVKFESLKLSLYDLQKVHGFNLIIDTVKQIKAFKSQVVLGSRSIGYDYLIVALGAGKMKHPGSENTFSTCGTPEQSLQIRDQFQALLKKGQGKIAVGFGGNPKDPSAVRGGPAFEILFNFFHIIKKHKLLNNFEIVFFAPMKEPGKRLGDKALEMMSNYLGKIGIKSQVGVKITQFEKDKIVFENGREIESDLTVFVAAGTGHPILQNSGLPLSDAGFIKIDDQCKILGIKNVYAVGDIAQIEGPEWASKQGHLAEVMANAAVYNIHQEIKNSKLRKGYQKHLNIICIMDTGSGAFYTYRDDKKAKLIPLPVIGHWLKKGWGFYWKYSKLRRLPRIPGM